MAQSVSSLAVTPSYGTWDRGDRVDHDEGYGDFTSSGHHDRQPTHERGSGPTQEAESSTNLTNATQPIQKENETPSEVRVLFLPRLDIMLFIMDSAAVKHSF